MVGTRLDRRRQREVPELLRHAPQARYEGARGPTALRDRHVRQTMYLAQAAGCDFDVLDVL